MKASQFIKLLEKLHFLPFGIPVSGGKCVAFYSTNPARDCLQIGVVLGQYSEYPEDMPDTGSKTEAATMVVYFPDIRWESPEEEIFKPRKAEEEEVPESYPEACERIDSLRPYYAAREAARRVAGLAVEDAVYFNFYPDGRPAPEKVYADHSDSFMVVAYHRDDVPPRAFMDKKLTRAELEALLL